MDRPELQIKAGKNAGH